MASVWIVLAVWLAFWSGAAGVGAYHHLHFRRIGVTFRGKVRCQPDRWCDALPDWPRHRVRAVWVHDVLFVGNGIVRPRVSALSPCAAERAVRTTTRLEVTRLGTNPAVLQLRLDDGRLVEVACRGRDIPVLVGPFVTAALPVLPAPDVKRNQ
jgi:hypothetical protein